MRRLASIDLNLLVALEALLAEEHVTRAGQRIGLSQPAMSHALARLRELLGDELLVRTPDGMRATAFARELAPRVRRVVEELEGVLLESRRFEPATAERRFVIATNDYGGAVLIPPLVRRLRQSAPLVQLRVRPLPAAVPVQELADGELDLVIGTFPSPPDPVICEVLFHERFACLVSTGSGAAATSLGLDEFCQAPHALIASPGEGPGLVDAALDRLGRSRRVSLYLPHFLVAAAVVAESDLVVTLPERIAVLGAREHAVSLHEPPVEVPPFPVQLVWHPRSRGHAASEWLREQIRAVGSETLPA